MKNEGLGGPLRKNSDPFLDGRRQAEENEVEHAGLVPDRFIPSALLRPTQISGGRFSLWPSQPFILHVKD
jgi:hypothetical protein